MKKLFIVLFLLVSFNLFSIEISSPYLPWVIDRCAIYDVPPEIAISIAIVESNFKMVVSTENWNGSKDIGIFQINSRYVKWFEKALWYKDRNFDPYNPYDNIEMGIIYLRHLYDHTHTWDLTVMAYNAGLSKLKKDPDLAYSYLVKVINTLNTLKIKGDM